MALAIVAGNVAARTIETTQQGHVQVKAVLSNGSCLGQTGSVKQVNFIYVLAHIIVFQRRLPRSRSRESSELVFLQHFL